MITQYAINELKRLRNQWIANKTPAQLLQISDRAEDVLRKIDSSAIYTLREVLAQVEPNWQTTPGELRVSGEAVQTDLRRLILDLSEASGAETIDASQRVYTTDEAAKLMRVSTKTITRWREQGLVARKLKVDGRRRVVFYDTSLRHYMSENESAVGRAAKFRQLTSSEQQTLINEARRHANEGLPFSDVLKRTANDMDVSVETVRSLVTKYDAESVNDPIFNAAQQERRRRKMILERFDEGETTSTLARRFGMSEAVVERTLWTQRAQRIVDKEIEYVMGREFELPEMKRELLAPAPESERTRRLTPAPSGLPAHLASLYEVPLLTAEQEFHLFRKYNYMKYLADVQRRDLQLKRIQKTLVRKVERLLDEAEEVRNWLIRANMRLVVAVAKKYAHGVGDLTSLMSEGNVTLMRATEKFDFGRGFKFSTYATWALKNCFARSYTKEAKFRSRFATADEEILNLVEDDRATREQLENEQAQRDRGISRILRHLDDREKRIITARFGLDKQREPMKLKDVGRDMGVSKERVRQIESRALAKLRQAATIESVSIDLLGL